MIQEFSSSAAGVMVEQDYYGALFQLKKVQRQCCEALKEVSKPFVMEGFYIEARHDEEDTIRDLIKRCPNCKEVWMRTEACSVTTCGRRPTNFLDYSKKSKFSYYFEILNRKVRVEKKDSERKSVSSVSEKIQEFRRYQNRKET